MRRVCHLAVAFLVASFWATPAFTQTLQETIEFIEELASLQGYVRAPDCSNKVSPSLSYVSKVYTLISTGGNLGLVEFNHGRPNSRTGHTEFDLHDIEKIEYGGRDKLDQDRNYYAVRFNCKAGAACIEKLTFCTGESPERQMHVSVDALFFAGPSSAERVAQAFNHWLDLIRSKDKSAPF